MEQTVALIGAIALNGVYGRGRGPLGSIPWKSKEDMKFFRATTMGGTVVMGRGTWESLPQAFRPLKGRTNFIITNNPVFVISQEDVAKRVKIFGSVFAAIEAAPTEKVFVIGGGDIWYNTAEYAHELLINQVGLRPDITEDSVIFKQLLDPTRYFHDFVQEGEPTLMRDASEDGAFDIHCFRYVRK